MNTYLANNADDDDDEICLLLANVNALHLYHQQEKQTHIWVVVALVAHSDPHRHVLVSPYRTHLHKHTVDFTFALVAQCPYSNLPFNPILPTMQVGFRSH